MNTSTLPSISFVKHKPEPLDTEFRDLVDGISGQMLWLEIQEDE